MSIDAGTAMRQAPMTVQLYMLHAKTDIDDRFGEGYAEEHPELVAAYITACTADFHSWVISEGIARLNGCVQMITEYANDA